jgi:hypothetical protein
LRRDGRGQAAHFEEAQRHAHGMRDVAAKEMAEAVAAEAAAEKEEQEAVEAEAIAVKEHAEAEQAVEVCGAGRETGPPPPCDRLTD